MDQTIKAKMSSGPRLYSFQDNIHYYGAYVNLSLGEKERGKTLQVDIDSSRRPVCWIELWPGHHDGKDWVNWTHVRGQVRGQVPVLQSGNRPQPNPSTTWVVEPGDYTIYFVNSSKTKQVSEDMLTFHIKTS